MTRANGANVFTRLKGCHELHKIEAFNAIIEGDAGQHVEGGVGGDGDRGELRVSHPRVHTAPIAGFYLS